MSYYQVPHFCGIYYIPHTTVINIYPPPTPSWLPQVSLSTESKLFDTSSRTILTQTFVNPSKSDAIAKASYNFPLYESCAVVAFRCFVGDRLIEGVVKEKDEAKADYKAAIEKGETAGLLEQFTPDVFRTSLGNIPAGATIKVEVEYIMELKHDVEVDGLRFTIPTSIAPRYGTAPSDLATYSDGKPIAGATEKGGMKISVQVTMPSNIRAVQSPSHPITMHLGGHVENVADDAFNPKHALATLGQTFTELGSDFILFVKCADLASPRALLERHNTKDNSQALMVTLVPKFTLPAGPKPEIVFVVDRSGSMSGRMEPLKSSLSVFLKSLPVGVKFNICSFGSSHSFLWSKSQAYSANTLAQAQKHVDSMDADMGGTEILPSIKATVSKRFKDLSLEIMVLTDGEVWDTDPLFKFIEKETASGDVRVFSLGIGRDVSHSLVEGMARVGRGFAQIVSDEKEGIEGKVVRMLRGGLSAHIKDYRLEWDGRPTEEQAKTEAKAKSTSTLQRALEGVKKKISLFDKQAETEPPISSGGTKADGFAGLPEFAVPTVLQAPYKLPPLFPFSRTTAYVILTGSVPPPSSVWLRGTTPSGDELELEIPVQVLPASGQTIHQLAARKMLQELEEGTGYIHSGNYGVNKETNPGTFDDWVNREGIRLGVEYGLASKWTSFVAVPKRKKAKEVVKVDEKQEETDEKKVDTDADDDGWTDIDSVTEVGDARDDGHLTGEKAQDKTSYDQVVSYALNLPPTLPPPPPASGPAGSVTSYAHAAPMAPMPPMCLPSPSQAPMAVGGGRSGAVSSTPPAPVPFMTLLPAPQFTPPPNQQQQAHGTFSTPTYDSAAIAQAEEATRMQSERIVQTHDAGIAPDVLVTEQAAHLHYATKKASMMPGFRLLRKKEKKKSMDNLAPSAPGRAAVVAMATPVVAPTMTTKDRVKALIDLQSFEGSFPLSATLASLLQVQLTDLESKLSAFTPTGSGKLAEQDKTKLWATLLAVCLFESKLGAERDTWELVVEKANDWISGLSSVQSADVDKLRDLAREVLGV